MPNIPDSAWAKYRTIADFFIDNDNIGKQCKLIYPPKKTTCSNCVTNTIGSTSTNVWRHGGPAPFNFGNCPMCGGNGYQEDEVSDNIRLRIYWSSRDWKKVADIQIPDAQAMIIGYISDLPKVRKAITIELVSEQTHSVWATELAGEPFPHGFGKNRYFIGFVKRK